MSPIHQDGTVIWTGPPTRADLNGTPGFRVVELAGGGDLTIAVDAEGNYRVSIDHGGVHFSRQLAPVDVAGINAATGDLLRERMNEEAA